MNEEINLLDPNKRKGPSVLLARLKTTRTLVIGVLFIVSVTSVILFILVALSPLPALQRQEATLNENLTLSKTEMVKYALLQERTTDITSILTKRHTLNQTISLIQNKLPNDITVTALQGDTGVLTITVESPSLQSIDSFLSGLISLVQAKKMFKQISITELTVDQASNDYLASLRLALL